MGLGWARSSCPKPLERISFNIPLWPAIVSGLLYVASINGLEVPLWFILLPLLPYAILAALATVALVIGIVIFLASFFETLSK